MRVVLVEPQHPGNIGAVARAMANFGLKDLGMVKGCGLADESYARSKSGRPILENSKRLKQLRSLLLNVISLLVLVESDLREIKDGLEHLKILKKLTKLSLKGKILLYFSAEKIMASTERS